MDAVPLNRSKEWLRFTAVRVVTVEHDHFKLTFKGEKVADGADIVETFANW
jgi:hypothetical protein